MVSFLGRFCLNLWFIYVFFVYNILSIYKHCFCLFHKLKNLPSCWQCFISDFKFVVYISSPHYTIASKTGFRLYTLCQWVYILLKEVLGRTLFWLTVHFLPGLLNLLSILFVRYLPVIFLTLQNVWFLPFNLLGLKHSNDCWLTWVLFWQDKPAIPFSYDMYFPSNSILLVTITLKNAYFTYGYYGFIINLQARKK